MGGSARNRRRHRRRDERQIRYKSEGKVTQENTVRIKKGNGPIKCDDSTASESASWSSDSCPSLTTAPKSTGCDPLNTNTTNKKTRSRKRKGSKKKPAIVNIEEIPEEEKVKYLAMDCEMVGVGKYGEISVLARVSITDWEGDIVLDRFVKVERPVTDYRTHVSGICPDDIESDDALDIEDCREMVMNIISDKVVIGHALRNDFYALKLAHPWNMIRDTARYEPFMKEETNIPAKLVPRKLRELARDKLGLMIQEEGKAHDSVQDASAAMELYKKSRIKWEKAVEWKMNKTASFLERGKDQ